MEELDKKFIIHLKKQVTKQIFIIKYYFSLVIQGLVTEDSIPNIIQTIQKKRTNENYHEILTEYIRTNSDFLSIKSKKINSSFFKNLNTADNSIKKDKLKSIILNLNKISIQKNIKNIFIKWKETTNKQNTDNNQINFKSNFFDSCLSLNKNNNELKNDCDLNENINDNNISKDKSNKDNSNSISNISNNKEASDNNILLSNEKKDKIFTNNKGISIQEKSFDFDDNIFPKYNDKNNDSVIINKDLSFNDKDLDDYNTNVDIFDVKINDNIIMNDSKENSKIKSDMFESNNINNSINVNISNSKKLDDKVCNISSGKDIDIKISLEKNKEKDNSNKLEEINIYNPVDKNNLELNEICNISIKEKESVNDNNPKTANYLEEKNNNTNEGIIINTNNDKDIKNNNLLTNDINGLEIIKSNSNKSRNELSQINDQNNKLFFDSLENIGHPDNKANNTFNKNNPNLKKNKNIKLVIQNNKIKILNQFLTLEKIPLNKKYNTPKRAKFQISETNNIFLNKNMNNKKKNYSFYCTNQTKVENIFIKGENKSQYKTESKLQKNLELFIIDKNDNIFIKHNTNKNKNINEKNINNYNSILERLIDSKMIINFLNNSKNEPMFPSKNYSTIDATSKAKLYLNNKINKSNNYTNLKNLSQNKKNHFYLKKKIVNNGLNSNLNFNEMELIEPDIQICPVSNSNIKNINKSKEINGIYKKLNNENIIEDLLKIKKRKNILKFKNSKKNLSYDLNNNNRTFNKYNTYEQNGNITGKKNHSISNDLIEFINKAKKNNKRNSDKNSGEIYNFKTIKYDKFNTYRENLKKKKITNERNSKKKIIFGNLPKIGMNKNIKKNIIKNNNILGTNKKSYVDYKRLNELYLDYKIKSIKRNKLRKEQDLKSGITFIPNSYKYNTNYIN